MANQDAAYGLVPVRSSTGASSSFEVMDCLVSASDSTAIYPGDIVVIDTTNHADGATRGLVTVQAGQGSEGTPSTNIFGVMVGVEVRDTNTLNQKHRPASTEQVIKVVPAYPGTRFRVNADEGTSTTAMGAAFDLVDSGADTVGQRSGFEIDGDTETTQAQVKVVGIHKRPDNEITSSDAVGIDYIVEIIESYWVAGGAGV